MRYPGNYLSGSQQFKVSSHGGTEFTKDTELLFENFTFSSEFPRKTNKNIEKFESSSVCANQRFDVSPCAPCESFRNNSLNLKLLIKNTEHLT